jgi:hypothetical protein
MGSIGGFNYKFKFVCTGSKLAKEPATQYVDPDKQDKIEEVSKND